MDIEYTIQIWQEGDQFIAHAMPLDVMSSGATTQASREALYEAVDLFIATASDTGTLSDILSCPATGQPPLLCQTGCSSPHSDP